MRKRLLWAGMCAGLALGWQALTVKFNHGGNWTALFCTGTRGSIPEQLRGENIYRFAGSDGYDGQFYHYMAHDPLMRRDFARHVDAARMRYRRILVPGLAQLAALGRDERVDGAYLGVCLAFLSLGAYWLSAYAEQHGRRAAWGMAFLLLPASIVQVDRLVVDGALTALTAGFALYAARAPSWRLYVILAAAALARETGWLLAAACAVHWLWEKQWGRAASVAATGIPALTWYVFVQAKTGSSVFSTSPIPFQETIRAVFHRADYPASTPLPWLVQATDKVALAGMLLALGLAVRAAVKRRGNPAGLACALFFPLAALLQRDETWLHVYDYGRIFSPLLLLLALEGIEKRRWWLTAPVLMMLPRLGMQLGRQGVGVAQGIIGI